MCHRAPGAVSTPRPQVVPTISPSQWLGGWPWGTLEFWEQRPLLSVLWPQTSMAEPAAQAKQPVVSRHPSQAWQERVGR